MPPYWRDLLPAAAIPTYPHNDPMPMNHHLGKNLPTMQTSPIGMFLLAAIALPFMACGQAFADPDPTGILRKPIPDKLVVLTFDDACASGYTVAAPILKSLGFGGSFYVCDFDSFKTRKDWYLTWRQMRALNDEGFEVGNHTVGHGGSLEAFVAMDNALFANHGPKMTTVCWPLYNVNWNICKDLANNDYTFGRGGHECPYRPTLDNPFDVPSYTMNDGVTMQAFTKIVRRAVNGKIVVLTYHGVPDMEHGSVSVKAETFKAMMQYLKDNHYQAIAMRDLTGYIDPAKAAKLPQKSGEFKEPDPVALASEDQPYVAPPAKDIQEFNIPNLPSATISQTHISITVPHATDVTALIPNIKLSDGASIKPASGTPVDFSTPQNYTVTSKDGSTKIYAVTVEKAAISAAKDILTFELPGATAVTIAANRVGVYVPGSTDLKALTPTFVLSPFAVSSPPSGTTRDFTQTQTYTIRAQDGSSRSVSVVVVRSDKPNSFVWSKAEGGNWSDGAKWSHNLAAGQAPASTGQSDGMLTFSQRGTYAANNDLTAGFKLNQLNLTSASAGLTLGGNAINFVKNGASGVLPALQAIQNQGIANISTPINLTDDLHVNMNLEKDPNVYLTLSGLVSGSGALVLNSHATEFPAFSNHDAHYGIIRLTHSNTYSGGSFVNGGKIILGAPDGLGTGPVMISGFGTIQDSSGSINALTINNGYLYSCTWNGPVTLNGISSFYGDCKIHGGISGAGGFVMLGTPGTYLNMTPGGSVTLDGTNTYSGPTTVFPGTLIVKKAASLYNADPAKWTPTSITIHKAATLCLNVGGPAELTGSQVGKLVGNLTSEIHDNGLMGGSLLCLDTSNAADPVLVSAAITDSKGPGGGPFLIKKCGPGILRLSGNNTYTGQTVLETGSLSVSSFNSITKGRASSSLGAPPDIEAGEIVIGNEGKDGDCCLIYTGTGETSDRVLNLAGKLSTVTIDQAGSGLLKFTSDLLISGYGADKTLALGGNASGSGELAGAITNPYDRAGKASTSVIKSGAGIWVLSGTNTHTGPTIVKQGTLSIASKLGLGDKTDVYLCEGAVLSLNFNGEMRIGKLYLDGKLQPAGTYGTLTNSTYLKGQGVLKCHL